MPTTVDTAGTLYPAQSQQIESVWRATNGALWAVFDDPLGTPSYSVSTDGGATWSPPAAIGAPLTFSSIQWIAAVQEPGTDHVWVLTTQSDVGLTAATVVKLTFDTTHSTVASSAFFSGGPGGLPALDPFGVHCLGGMAWDSTNSLIHGMLLNVGGTGLRRMILLTINPAGLAMVATTTSVTWSGDAWNARLTIKPGSSPAEVYAAISDSNATTVYPFVYTGGAYSTNPAGERCYAGGVDFLLGWDASNRLDVVLLDGSNLYATKRTSTNTYSPTVSLYGGVVSGTHLAWSQDSSSGDLAVFFMTEVNQSAGEVYVVRRSAGTWSAPQLFAGGDDTGYSWAGANHDVEAGSAPVVVRHLGVQFYTVALAGAPNKPSVSSPSGNITTITPPLSAPYSAAAGDGQKSYQWQVQTADGITTMLDTGEAVSTATTITYAGDPLSFGSQYQARVRYKDSLSAAGAGTWSDWSNWSTFTPLHGPVPVITDVISDADYSAFPATIGSPTLEAIATCTQADSHAFNRAVVNLYDTDGVTLLASGTPFTLSPQVASGGTIDVPAQSFLTSMVNGHVYHLALAVTDATTGLVGESAHVQLTSSWTGPGAPSDFALRISDDAGTVHLSWVLNEATVACRVEMEAEAGLHPGVIEVQWNGGPITERTMLLNPTIPTTLRVVAIDALGLESSAELRNVCLGIRAQGDQFGIWWTDADNPTDSAALGIPQNSDSLTYQWIDNAEDMVPLGEQYAKTWFDLTGYHISTSALQWVIPSGYTLKSGDYVTAEQDVALFDLWKRTHPLLLYRDIWGQRFLCQLRAVVIVPLTTGEWELQFTVQEKAPRATGVSY